VNVTWPTSLTLAADQVLDFADRRTRELGAA
jgi:hypothetical protein